MLMKLFSVFIFQLLAWISVQETSIAELWAGEALKQHETGTAGICA